MDKDHINVPTTHEQDEADSSAAPSFFSRGFTVSEWMTALASAAAASRDGLITPKSMRDAVEQARAYEWIMTRSWEERSRRTVPEAVAPAPNQAVLAEIREDLRPIAEHQTIDRWDVYQVQAALVRVADSVIRLVDLMDGE